jgi:hypothetical protein
MKYEVIKSCVIQGKKTKVGDVVSIEDKAAVSALIGIGRIVPYVQKEEISDRSIGLSDDSVKTRVKKKK